MTPGEAMKYARNRAGMTMKQLSDASGVPESCISRYEKDLTVPLLSTVELMADALGLSIDSYVGHEVIGSCKLKVEVLTNHEKEWAYNRWCEGYTYVDIAAALKVSPETVQKALRRRQRIRPKLIYDEGD